MAKKITGYASVFNSRSCDMGFYEEVDPQAFDAVLRSKPDVVCLYNHEASALLGRTASGTLNLSTDKTGLLYRCDLPGTQLGNDVGELVSRGDLNASSFGFMVGSDEWGIDTAGNVTRRILGVAELFDVSPVTTPAYRAATVQIARSSPAVNHNDTPEQVADRAHMKRVLAEINAADRAKQTQDNRKRERMRREIEDTLIRSGTKPEAARAMVRGGEVRGTKGGRTFRIGTRAVSEAEFLSYARSKGLRGLETRLKQTKGKTERVIVRGPMATE